MKYKWYKAKRHLGVITAVPVTKETDKFIYVNLNGTIFREKKGASMFFRTFEGARESLALFYEQQLHVAEQVIKNTKHQLNKVMSMSECDKCGGYGYITITEDDAFLPANPQQSQYESISECDKCGGHGCLMGKMADNDHQT